MLKKYAILTRQVAITLDIATVILSFITAYYVRIGILNIIPLGIETKLKDYSAILIMLAIVWWGLLNALRTYSSNNHKYGVITQDLCMFR